MKKILLFLLLFLFTKITNAQHITLSNSSEISVLTIGPGTSLNDAFGHSAFRINDPIHRIDVTYDYGRFDFEAPNFYLNFARGKLNYSIGDSTYNDFLSLYIRQNRTVKEQVLNISQSEKQKIYDYLLENNKPENRNYLYEFFFDNCATKIKDVTRIAVNNNITFKTPTGFKPENFRKLIHNNVKRNSWGAFGIDIALGSVIDRKATPEEHMFLPENIFTFFENATFKSSDKPLIKDSKTLYLKKEKVNTNDFLMSPLFVFGTLGLLIIFITYKDYKKNKRSKWLDIILFGLTGIVGVLILLLWFATDHTGTHQNYNLLWAFTLNIIALRQVFKNKASLWFIKYLKLLVILLCLLTLHWIIGVQIFAIGLLPFLIALCLRYVFLINYQNSQ